MSKPGPINFQTFERRRVSGILKKVLQGYHDVRRLVSCLRGSPNKSPGYGSLGKACHPESFDCHSERSEESQDKLREGS